MRQPVYAQWTTQRRADHARRFSPCSGRSSCTSRPTPPARLRPTQRSTRRCASCRMCSGRRYTAPTDATLEAVIGDLLRERSMTIAVAESCSGGLLASRLTDVPGSSDYVERGVVCYSNRAKTELARRARGDDREHGAVSEPVARGDGRRAFDARAGANVGIGITGIAGPGGGTPEKPVGTVAIAVVVRRRIARADVPVHRRPRDGEVPVGAIGDEHAAADAAQRRATSGRECSRIASSPSGSKSACGCSSRSELPAEASRGVGGVAARD